jgi:hypothetical protein
MTPKHILMTTLLLLVTSAGFRGGFAVNHQTTPLDVDR